MLFSSPAFLFCFLPIFLVTYFLTKEKYRNALIFLFSIGFYFIDGGFFTSILLASVFINFWLAIGISRMHGLRKTLIVAFAVTLNLVPLFFYKYWMFFLQSFNDAASVIGADIHVVIPEIVLLSGVSFFTFHAISYIIDVSNEKVRPEPSCINFGMYMTNFPQLIAGPIVRYSEIASQVNNRLPNKRDIFLGIFIFIIGLSKKVIFADSAGNIADRIFDESSSSLSTAMAWVGAIAYSLQIYFDFSGYSDMAIGLGKIMGFNFPENFNQPYRSKSITEFWRRWHMTLSRWFRDYVYIPLGGNKNGQSRTLTNLLIVFFLCGLWHGASYTFIAWGFYHGLLLIIERILKANFNFSPSGALGQIITLILVIIGWVIFRATSLPLALHFIGVMFGMDSASNSLAPIINLFTFDVAVYFLAALAASLIPMELFEKFSYKNQHSEVIVKILIALPLFVFCLLLIADNGFNPFIYFRF
ncbi:MBOAT family protein [Polynucleobacter sp. UB-Raua-W9]|uniref:MBOAT family O-acyltransferase n=1 Tax=Polynucleobacter sp. UB-Raua-W9 TaxID=1819736 RepID=UPI001BFDC9CF|nr:MBOAT family O-acyltransferase [Polynucleobacter sp. UB-Raua-W9]QWD72734.1 MBOAT family protein [Polynucleobacter sp. UB-Raua-W9]